MKQYCTIENDVQTIEIIQKINGCTTILLYSTNGTTKQVVKENAKTGYHKNIVCLYAVYVRAIKRGLHILLNCARRKFFTLHC